MNELERVREQIAKFIFVSCHTYCDLVRDAIGKGDEEVTYDDLWDDLPAKGKLPFYNQAVHILCTKGIRIECDDQSLPEIELFRGKASMSKVASMLEKAQEICEAMLKPDSEGNHWVKVRPKGKYEKA